ncbi:MAG TPA: lysylphosphatidylglycerol synthase domain-containing protein, partial [Azospirillum sp.]
MRALIGSSWFRAVVSAVLLAAVLSRVDGAALAQALARAQPGYLAAGVLLGLAQVVLAAYRWHMLLDGRGPAVPFAAVLRIQFVSGFFGLFLPGGVGTEVIRLYSLSRLTGSVALSVTSILVERAFALLTLFALVQAGLLLSPPGMPVGVAAAGWTGFAVLGALAAAL